MMAQDAAPVKGIFATGLTSNLNADDSYTFAFNANANATEACLTFIDAETGELAGSIDLLDVKAGPNEITVPAEQIPGTVGQVMNWAVTLAGEPITEFNLLNDLSECPYTYSFNTVDKNPESNFFGNIYVGHRPGTASNDNGLWIHDANFNRLNSSVIKQRSDGMGFRSNFRIGIDSEGKVYMPDWGDGPSGVFVFNPADEAAGFKEFFSNDDGSSLSRNGGGLLTNANGEAVAGSSPGVAIAGKGADTKLFVYNEDVVVNGSGNNVSMYEIGNADGSIMDHWNQAPTTTFAIGAYQANANGNIVPDEQHGGIWVSQIRAKNQNTSAVPSLIYVDEAGNILYNSGEHSDIINGSEGAAFAITNDGRQLALYDGDHNVVFYNIEWSATRSAAVPTLTPANMQFSPASGIALSNGRILQMNFDYAGNLIMSGAKVGIYSVPSESNLSTVPAKKALTVEKKDILNGVDNISVKTKSGVRYNLMGQPVDENYKGIVIQDGKKFIQK